MLGHGNLNYFFYKTPESVLVISYCFVYVGISRDEGSADTNITH